MFSKKVFKNKVLNFGTIKVLWKSPWNKKLVEIKSYYFQTDFQGLFSSSNIIWYKKVPGKKSYKSRKWKVTRDFYSHAKKGLSIKTPLAIFNMQMYTRKVLLLKTSQAWPHFHKTLDYFSGFFLWIFCLQIFSFCDLISWGFIDTLLIF